MDDPLSFPFLAYASRCLARSGGRERGARPVVLTGLLMMLLDVVIDPLAVMGIAGFSVASSTIRAGATTLECRSPTSRAGWWWAG